MVRRIKKIVKKKPTRERKKLIVIGTEGDNKTETLYFREIEKTQSKYHFVFAKGNETDPVKIVNNTLKQAKREDLERRYGDIAISIFDLDNNSVKNDQLKIAKTDADKSEIMIITSNPCFEVWYLEHFDFSTKPFVDSHAVVEELKKKMPGYKKETCNFEILYPNTKRAIMNCKRLIKFHEENGVCGEFANPRTEVYKLIELIISKDK